MLRDYIARHIRVISSLPQTQRGRALWAHLAIDRLSLAIQTRTTLVTWENTSYKDTQRYITDYA